MRNQKDPSFASPVVLSVGSLFLILATFSAPYINGVRIFRLSTDVDRFKQYVDFGVTGYCVPEINGTVIRDPTVQIGCSGPGLGWIIDDIAAHALKTPGIEGTPKKASTMALITIPIALALTFASLLPAIALYKTISHRKIKGSNVSFRTARILCCASVFPLCASLVALGAALAVGILVDTRVKELRKEGANIRFKFDNGIWLIALAGLFNLWNVCFLYSLSKQLKKGEADKKVKKVAKKKGKISAQVEAKQNLDGYETPGIEPPPYESTAETSKKIDEREIV